MEKHVFAMTELARRAEVSRQTIIAVESGKYTPSLGLAFKLAKIFNRPIEEIFRVEEQDTAGVPAK